jgi:hypothetical protein
MMAARADGSAIVAQHIKLKRSFRMELTSDRVKRVKISARWLV